MTYISPEIDPTILFINSSSIHKGWEQCCTNEAIYQSLKKLSSIVNCIYEVDLSHYSLPKANFPEIYHEENLKLFKLKNNPLIKKIQQADFIIINGEDLIGSTEHNTLVLLISAYIAKTLYNKQVHIINLSICLTLHKQQPVQNTIYQNLFAIVDNIGVKDNLASHLLDQLEISHHHCFSLIPLYIENNFPNHEIENIHSIVIASINLLPVEVLTELSQYLSLILSTGFKIKVLLRTEDTDHVLQSLLASLDKNIDVIYSDDAKRWINTIATAKLLISSQSNDIISACFTNTPSISISNDLELDCLIQTLNIDTPISIFELNTFAETLLQRTVAVLENPSRFVPQKKQLNKLLLAAKNNFLSLPHYTAQPFQEKKLTCAIVTPVGPGHEQQVKEAQDSIVRAINHSKGPFSDIFFFPVDDTQAKLGRSAARNLAVQKLLTEGIDWIFFLDADDLLLPTIFESVMQHIQQYDAIWGVIAVQEKSSDEIRLRQPQYQLKNLKELVTLPAISTLQIGHFVKTAIAAKYPFDEQRNTGEDFDYYLRVWENEKCFKLSDQTFFINRRGYMSFGNRSATGSEWDKAIKTLQSNYKEKLNISEAESINITINATQLF